MCCRSLFHDSLSHSTALTYRTTPSIWYDCLTVSSLYPTPIPSGDCIHTVKPYFGVGVNSALEDVMVLNSALERLLYLSTALSYPALPCLTLPCPASHWNASYAIYLINLIFCTISSYAVAKITFLLQWKNIPPSAPAIQKLL